MIRLVAIPLLAITLAAAPSHAQSSDPTDPWTQCLGARPDTAIAGCTRVIETPVGTVNSFAAVGIAFLRRADAYLNKGDYPRAIADYTEAIRRRPSSAIALNSRGDAYSHQGDYDRAIADFTHALDLKSTSASAPDDLKPSEYALVFDNRGNAYSNKHDYARAIADYSEAIRRNPADPQAFDHRGNAYSDTRDYAHAIADFTAALRLNPKDATALYGRGIAKQATNDTSGANTDIAAAKQIDPNAGKFLAFVTSTTAPSAQSATNQATPPPACEVPAATAQSSDGTPIPAYVSDSPDQLKNEVPALRGIRFEASPNPSAAPDQSTAILSKTGADIAAQFRRMPNLIAREQVQHTTPLADANGFVDAQHTMADGQAYTRQPQTDATDTASTFTYRLLPTEDATSVREFRLDTHNQPLSDSANHSHSPRSIGFGASWLLFLPANLQESRFRYLGEQKFRNHQTYVLAFAQIPGRVRHGTVVETAGGSCSTLIQGIVWIDQATSEIVHLQTDLLSPLPGIHMHQLRAVLNYSQVKIPQRNLLLWLPSDVETTWSTAYNAGDELHTYSNYKLFAATARVLRPDQLPSQ